MKNNAQDYRLLLKLNLNYYLQIIQGILCKNEICDEIRHYIYYIVYTIIISRYMREKKKYAHINASKAKEGRAYTHLH